MALRAAAEDCDGVAAGARPRPGSALHRARRQHPGRGAAGLALRQPGPPGGARLGFAEGDEPRELMLSAIGGNTPQALMHDACLAISRGERDVVLVTGRRGHVRPRPGAAGPGPALAGVGEPARGHAAADLVRRGQGGRHRARDAAGVLLPGARLPPVRERAARRQRLDARGAPARIGALWSRFSEVAAANPHAWIRTAAHAPTRSSPRRPPTGWSRSPIRSCARPTCRSTRAPATSCARSRRPAPPACPRSAGSSPWPAPTATTTGSSPSGPSCTAPPPSGSPGSRARSWPAWASTTSPPSTSTRASRSWCRWRRDELGLAVDDPGRPLTLTGGLTFGGGPGNNYTSHGIARAVGALRARAGRGGARHRPGLVRHQALHRRVRLTPARSRRRAAVRLARRPARGRRPAAGARRRRAPTGPCASRPTPSPSTATARPSGASSPAAPSDGSRAWGNVTDPQRWRPVPGGPHRADRGIGLGGMLASRSGAIGPHLSCGMAAERRRVPGVRLVVSLYREFEQVARRGDMSMAQYRTLLYLLGGSRRAGELAAGQRRDQAHGLGDDQWPAPAGLGRRRRGRHG